MILARIDVTWARDAADGVSFKRSKGQRAQRARVVLYMYIVDFGDIQAGKRKKKAGYAISTITENFGSIFSLMQTQEIFFYMYMQCVYRFGIPQCRILGVCPASQLLQGSLEVHSLNAWIFPISFLNVYDKTTKKIEYADVKQKRTRKLCLHMDLTHIVAPLLCIEATSSATNTPGGDIDPWHNIRLNNQFGGWVSCHDRNSSDQMVWRSNPTRSVGHLVCSLSKARDEWLRVWFDLTLFTQK